MPGNLYEQHRFSLDEGIGMTAVQHPPVADEIRQTVQYVKEHSHTSDRGRAVEEAGNRLAANVMRLQVAVEKLISGVPSFGDDIQKMSGIEEAKLLSSIEKWQRRYDALDGQHRRLVEEFTAMQEHLRQMTHENELLRQALSEEQLDAEKRRVLQDEIVLRVEKTIATLDQILS